MLVAWRSNKAHGGAMGRIRRTGKKIYKTHVMTRSPIYHSNLTWPGVLLYSYHGDTKILDRYVLNERQALL